MATKKEGKLDKLRKSLKEFVKKANDLFEALKQTAPDAPALQEAMRSKSRAKGVNQDEAFSIDELHRERDLAREASRLKAFLAEGGQQYREAGGRNEAISRREELLRENPEGFSAFRGTYFDENGKQRNYWYDLYGVSYDNSRISTDDAKLAFSIYRKLEEADPTLIYGEGAYGSENLIVAIYDTLIAGGSRKASQVDLEADTILKVRAELYGAKPDAGSDFEISDRDYGKLDRVSKRGRNKARGGKKR
jgi:hypothetical protein